MTRPDALLGQVNEPLAGGFIYPAVLAAWAFVALYQWPREAFWAAPLVFFSGLIFIFRISPQESWLASAET
jgi:hypothetical protein